jgi:F-type H+-transporting ATPase subunit epsilon
MLTFFLQTPGRKLVQRVEVSEVQAPGVKGTLQILPGHANFVTQLETGVIKWRIAGEHELQTASVSWGFLQVKDASVSILADVSELGHEIDKGRAQVAFEKAKKKLEEGGLSDEDLLKYELKLQRALIRLQAAGQ